MRVSRSRRRSSRRLLPAWAALVVLGVAAAAPAQSPPQTTAPDALQRRLRVATYEDPPYSMRDGSGQWTGLVIDLWHLVADQMEVRYELVGYDPPDQIYGLLNAGELDLLAAAVPITLDSVQTIEFSSPFLSKGYVIATLPRTHTSWTEALGGPLARRLHGVLLALLALLVVASVVIWWTERRRNPAHFGGGMAAGIGNGLWWTATTMSTVGYGDRAPVTTAGRVVAMIVMLLSLVLVSTFTAIIASRLTVVELQPRITGIADLSHVRVGVLKDSPMSEYLRSRSIAFATFPDIERTVEALVSGRLDAVLGGEAELRYLADTRYEGRLALVPGVIDQGFVAFGLPTASPLRREIDAALLRVLESDAWRRLRHDTLRR